MLESKLIHVCERGHRNLQVNRNKFKYNNMVCIFNGTCCVTACYWHLLNVTLCIETKFYVCRLWQHIGAGDIPIRWIICQLSQGYTDSPTIYGHVFVLLSTFVFVLSNRWAFLWLTFPCYLGLLHWNKEAWISNAINEQTEKDVGKNDQCWIYLIKMEYNKVPTMYRF